MYSFWSACSFFRAAAFFFLAFLVTDMICRGSAAYGLIRRYLAIFFFLFEDCFARNLRASFLSPPLYLCCRCRPCSPPVGLSSES